MDQFSVKMAIKQQNLVILEVQLNTKFYFKEQ